MVGGDISKDFEKDFLEVMLHTSIAKEMDGVIAELFIHLFIEPDILSMDELVKKTGYSLSAISTKLKSMEEYGIVQRIKKPGSKKLYFYVDKNTGRLAIRKMRLYLQREVQPLKRNLPTLLEKYAADIKKSKDERFKKQYIIVQDYITQLKYTEDSILMTINYIENIIKKSEGHHSHKK